MKSIVWLIAVFFTISDIVGQTVPAFDLAIPGSGYDASKPDCGMSAAKVFDTLENARVGTLALRPAKDLSAASTTSVGFEGLDRGLFDPTPDIYEKLAAAGIKRARVQTMWSRCETKKGEYDFSVMDEVIGNLSSRGIRPWFSVTYGNTLYMTNCRTAAAVGNVPLYYGDECRAAWLKFVRTFAKRYRGKVVEWEIWNEPNVKEFWQPVGANAKDYIELVKIAGEAIRSEIPDAKIGGTTAADGIHAWEREFFERGGAKYIDFWSFHAYGLRPESSSLGTFLDAQREARRLMDANGGRHVVVWQGESGYPSWFHKGHWLFPGGVCQDGWQSQANQAKWLLRRFVTDRRAGIAVSSFYQASDIVRRYSMAVTTRPHPAEHGLLNGWTHEPKMSYRAMGYYNVLLGDAKYDAALDVAVSPGEDAGEKTVAAGFRRGNGTVAYVYYAPFDFSGSYTGRVYTARTDAKLTLPKSAALKNPVLVDLLRGGIYEVKAGTVHGDEVEYSGLPLVDYPVVLTDRKEFSVRDRGFAASLLTPQLAEMEREELTHPIHPGNPDAGVPFWNAGAFRYIYPPSFDFVKWPKAQHYRFKVYDANDKVRFFVADTPWAPLTPVWAELPVGRVTVICDAMGEGGQVVVKYCGTRTFWKDHPFGGRVAPKPRSYREAAVKAYDYILEFPPVKKFLETGTPDRSYDKFGYPSKTYSQLIKAMVFYAQLRPEKKNVAMKLAKMSADELAKESFPSGFALAGWPRTYTTTDGQRCVFPKKRDQAMLIYPLEVGEALLALAQATGDKTCFARAKAIADIYLKTRREDGTWPLVMDAKTGAAICANNLVAFELLPLFEGLAKETGDAVYAAAAKDAFDWLDEHALKDWYWEGQFEDVEQRPKYENLTGNLASKAAWTLVARFPNDPKRLAQARECVRFHEDQFVFWEKAFNPKDGTQPSRSRRGAVGRHFNTTPGVCEQYDCYCFVNGSAAHVALAWRALGKATGNALDLAKAKTMADQMVNVQQENGCIPTWWSPSKDEWINCHIFSANALYELSKDE